MGIQELHEGEEKEIPNTNNGKMFHIRVQSTGSELVHTDL